LAGVLRVQFVAGGVLEAPHRRRLAERRATAIAATNVRRGPRLPQGSAMRRLRLQFSNVGKGNAGNTPASGNEGVGEHVRTRFQIDPKAACGIANSLRRIAPNEENLFLLPDRERERSDR